MYDQLGVIINFPLLGMNIPDVHYVACWTEDDGVYCCGHTHLDVRDATDFFQGPLLCLPRLKGINEGLTSCNKATKQYFSNAVDRTVRRTLGVDFTEATKPQFSGFLSSIIALLAPSLASQADSFRSGEQSSITMIRPGSRSAPV